MTAKQIGIVCTSPAFGGLEMNTLKLAQWLQEDGWTVRLLLNEQSEIYKRAKNYAHDIATIQDIAGEKIKKLNAGIIKKWLNEKSVPCLLTPYNKDIAALSLNKRFKNRNIKLVYQQHMKVGVKKRDIIHTFRYDMLNVWISPLQYLKEETLRYTRVPASKIVLIPFGLETEHFLEKNITKTEARKQLALPENANIIGLLGRIDPMKEQAFMIKVIAHLKQQYQLDYHLVIMGAITYNTGDTYLHSLHQLTEELGLQQQIHFRDFAPDVVPFYKAIDVFAMPSSGETFGMVTIEAMLSGCPVIGTNADGTKEILQDGKIGYLYEYNNLDSFCTQLQALKNNPSLPTLLHNAQQEVIHKYSKEKMMEGVETLPLH
jgi:glycosyltransferase involved in cell wall biosynthesis